MEYYSFLENYIKTLILLFNLCGSPDYFVIVEPGTVNVFDWNTSTMPALEQAISKGEENVDSAVIEMSSITEGQCI